ncbi:hypothetical protein V22_40490 [Calycomorphotria hydatis]|uniref:Uncharacterized protein n=1 Tax=Calycomorphotria hydatis TaxID=2528027 RepID=A0A517TEH2_9PLAN|nr:hypothetical protein V22_40490 [Calycomorphotria hydatis]
MPLPKRKQIEFLPLGPQSSLQELNPFLKEFLLYLQLS